MKHARKLRTSQEKDMIWDLRKGINKLLRDVVAGYGGLWTFSGLRDYLIILDYYQRVLVEEEA